MDGLKRFVQLVRNLTWPRWISAVAAVGLLMGGVFLAICTFSAMRHAEPANVSQDVFRFDAGPSGSAIERGAAGLDCEADYSSEVGFGWTHRPQGGFDRQELVRSRSAMTIDGVSGKQLAFRADIGPGMWFLTCWVEAGQEDARKLKLTVQGRERTLGWHAFQPPEEPPRSGSKTYRVFHGKTTVGSDGLSFALIGGEDEIRLLGCSLIRQVNPTKPGHRQLMEQLALAGRFKSSESLTDLATLVGESLRHDPTDAFYALWHEQLGLLVLAERYFSMRGWEWADEETGLGLFDRLNQAVMLLDGVLATETEQAGPLTERALYTRGRILYWLGEELHQANEIAGGQRDLMKLYANHRDDAVLAMYTGERIDLPDACDCLETKLDAPAWSVAQREALCRLRQISDWWVNERQSASGEFGGKFGDDVELLRWWVPLILSGDETAKRGWQKLADGVWRSKHVHEGYAQKIRDVEHASEFVADTAPLMVIVSDDARYVDRLTYSAKHFSTLWTGMTAKGHRFFRSAWFSSTAVETEEPKGRDTEYNSRAVQAVRYLAWRRSDPAVVELLHEWSAAWLSAAMRTDKGKPRGIIPASVRFTDEAINGDGSNWYQANMFWPYYDWEQFAGSMMLDQLLFTYTLTKDEQLLTPMFLALDLIRAEESRLVGNSAGSLREGSRTWAADKLMRQQLFWSVVEQWRFLTGDSRWDDLILRHGTQYGRFRLNGNEKHLVEGLDVLLDSIRYNTPMRTTEVIHTDRVYAPGWEHLKAMLTGDGIWGSLSPYLSVSWEGTDEDFTALVCETGSDRLSVQLYSHSPEERRIIMRLWQLAPGEYRLRFESQGQEPQEELIMVQDSGERIPITLPGQQLLTVRLELVP